MRKLSLPRTVIGARSNGGVLYQAAAAEGDVLLAG